MRRLSRGCETSRRVDRQQWCILTFWFFSFQFFFFFLLVVHNACQNTSCEIIVFYFRFVDLSRNAATACSHMPPRFRQVHARRLHCNSDRKGVRSGTGLGVLRLIARTRFVFIIFFLSFFFTFHSRPTDCDNLPRRSVRRFFASRKYTNRSTLTASSG